LKIVQNVIECYGCGTFLDITDIDSKITCPKCYSIIDIKNHSKEALIYAISALLLFLVLPLYPLLTTNINGTQLYGSIIQIPLMLYKENFICVSILIFWTIILAPILNSIVIIFSFFEHNISKKFMFKLYHITKEWVFIDVFLVGCVVSYIKMTKTFQNTHFEIGFYIMIFYLILFYLSNQKFDEKMILKK